MNNFNISETTKSRIWWLIKWAFIVIVAGPLIIFGASMLFFWIVFLIGISTF